MFPFRALLVGVLFVINNTVSADVAVVVSAKSPVATLTQSQVADAFLGRGAPLATGVLPVPLDMPEDSSVRQEFYAKVVGKDPVQLKAHWMRRIFTGKGEPPRVMQDVVQLKKFVAANPHAVTYVDSSHVDASIRVVLLIK